MPSTPVGSQRSHTFRFPLALILLGPRALLACPPKYVDARLCMLMARVPLITLDHTTFNIFGTILCLSSMQSKAVSTAFRALFA